MVPKGIDNTMTVGLEIVPNGNAQVGGDDPEFKKPFFSYRWAIVYIGFFNGCSVFFVRNSFPVAVVAMANVTTSETEESTLLDTCPSENSTDSSTEAQDGSGEFYWSTNEQGIILGAYFWGFILSKLFVSRLGERFGPRLTVAFGTMIAGLLCLLSPLAANIGPYALAVVRFLIGVCYGPMPAANHCLLSKWAPRNELSSMVSTMFSGATFGGMVGLIAAGWLSDTFGWKSVFWVGGVISFIVPPIWITVVRNTPRKHPWLSNYERRLLEQNKHITTKKTVPWKKILTSPYVIICMFCLFARSWLDIILATECPSFFRYKMGLDLSTSSYVCGANYLSALVAILAFGRLSDLIINKKCLSKLNTRRLFHIIGAGGGALLLVSICIANCHTVVVIVLWILIGGIACGTVCSFNVSVIDIAPNYAGTVMGILGVGNLGGALTPVVTSAFLSSGNGWNKTFYLTALMCVISCIIYIPFMTAEAQSWNFEEEQTKEEESQETPKKETD